MILVDAALRARAGEGRPVRVALVGAGFMGRGFARQLINSTPGMELVAVVNRHVEGAERAYREVGLKDVERVHDLEGLDKTIEAGLPAVTDSPELVCASGLVDCVVEATGDVEYGARVALAAIAGGTDLVLLNAEVDGTVGPLLKSKADGAGIVYTGADGDQPGVQMNLVRFVRGIGLEPLVCGNIKGLQDPYRNPTTQEGFAKRWGQDPHMVTSFADGTKISFEQAIVANATGMTVAKRGMRGSDHLGHVDELTGTYDVEELRALGGVVDYVVGSKPGPGVFVFGMHDDPVQKHYLELYKLGAGPLYSFYTPYHLCHFEVPTTVAKAVLFRDATLAPIGGPRVEVVTTAKTNLAAGVVLDGLGGYHHYGQAERAEVTAAQRLLPQGVAAGCRVLRDLPQDHVLTYEDVELPADRQIDALRREQAELFGLS